MLCDLPNEVLCCIIDHCRPRWWRSNLIPKLPVGDSDAQHSPSTIPEIESAAKQTYSVVTVCKATSLADDERRQTYGSMLAGGPPTIAGGDPEAVLCCGGIFRDDWPFASVESLGMTCRRMATLLAECDARLFKHTATVLFGLDENKPGFITWLEACRQCWMRSIADNYRTVSVVLHHDVTLENPVVYSWMLVIEVAKNSGNMSGGALYPEQRDLNRDYGAALQADLNYGSVLPYYPKVNVTWKPIDSHSELFDMRFTPFFDTSTSNKHRCVRWRLDGLFSNPTEDRYGEVHAVALGKPHTLAQSPDDAYQFFNDTHLFWQPLIPIGTVCAIKVEFDDWVMIKGQDPEEDHVLSRWVPKLALDKI
ncbi:hypothetical protein Pelo_1668 [Pelomyxa schiedti]|nr:hypothetical protein Pelo_1668 [Pelomyxa schiedti]